MKRDHMMGCAQTAQHPDDRTVHLSRRFPLGTPKRVFAALVEVAAAENVKCEAADEFETVDHTPAYMRGSISREYDTAAMAADKVNAHYAEILKHLASAPAQPWPEAFGANYPRSVVREVSRRDILARLRAEQSDDCAGLVDCQRFLVGDFGG